MGHAARYTSSVALLASFSFVFSIPTSLSGSHTRHTVAFVPASLHPCPRWSPRRVIRHRSSRGLRQREQAASSDSSSLEGIAPRILAQSTLPSVALVLQVGVRNVTARGSGFVVDFDESNDGEVSCRRVVYLLTAAHVALPGHRIGVVSNRLNDAEIGDRDNKVRYIVTDAAMAGGMSGGPLMDISSGVLGVNALINMELRALGNYAVSAAECIEFLNQMKIRRKGVAEKNNDKNAEEEMPTIYKVVLYNDRFNKRARVQDLLQQVAGLNVTESNRIMMEAHTNGRGVIRDLSGNEADANALCDALRREDLLVEVEAV